MLFRFVQAAGPGSGLELDRLRFMQRGLEYAGDAVSAAGTRVASSGSQLPNREHLRVRVGRQAPAIAGIREEQQLVVLGHDARTLLARGSFSDRHALGSTAKDRLA